MLVFNIFPRPFPIKDDVELTEKVENALRSKSKNAAVRQKETKFNEKGRSAMDLTCVLQLLKPGVD